MGEGQGQQKSPSTHETRKIPTREADRVLERAVEREERSGNLRITEGQRESSNGQSSDE